MKKLSLNINPVHMPVLALRGLVVFPGMLLHFDVGREKSINALNLAMETDQTIFLVSQKELKTENPSVNDLFTVGCVAKIRQVMKISDDNIRVLIEGGFRAGFENLQTVNNCLVADVTRIKEVESRKTTSSEAFIRNVKELFKKYAKFTPKMPKDISMTVLGANSPGYLSDYIASNIQMPLEAKQMCLEELNPTKRLRKVAELLNKECSILTIDAKIQEKVKEQIDDNQREYYLKEQLRAINFELYGDDGLDTEIESYREKISAISLNEENKNIMFSEVNKLSKMPFGSHEATVVRNYLDLLLSLPFGKYDKIKTDIEKAENLLNKEHYGLKKVKNRILEAMAVYALKATNDGHIICLAGPPGVGKTSIAKSLAKSMGRSFARVSLGGVHDEAEINGHRRTYIGAMPGRIVNALKKAGSMNPLILLDEVDKLGKDIKGDPASALLEVLDSEQNNNYIDHYVDMPIDLSSVLFVCTANDVSNIPAPLLDRMDLIELPSYTREEKFNICKNHLIKKQLIKHGLTAKQIKFDNNAIYDIIDYYTKESGVRSLERKIADILRKAAKSIVSGEKTVRVTTYNLNDFLGVKKYRVEELLPDDEVGVVNGLAWTSVGGEIMQLEVSVLEGSGKIELTGSLGDVMKESAKAAVSLVRKNAKAFGISEDFYKTKDIHIHATEAAVPKDGPSAGVTITTALVSALTDTPIKRDVAMTGEITILGRVLAIGGLTEKVMAAYRSGITTVIIPKENQKDLCDIPKEVLNAINFKAVSHIDEVLDTALIKNTESVYSINPKTEDYTVRI